MKYEKIVYGNMELIGNTFVMEKMRISCYLILLDYIVINCNTKYDKKVYGNLELIVNISVLEQMRTAALISIEI